MVRYENDCSNCAVEGYPCTGAHKHVPHLYCDKCGEEVDFAYDIDGDHICEGCLPEMFPTVEVSDLIGDE